MKKQFIIWLSQTVYVFLAIGILVKNFACFNFNDFSFANLNYLFDIKHKSIARL
jgi:hypothetical protein